MDHTGTQSPKAQGSEPQSPAPQDPAPQAQPENTEPQGSNPQGQEPQSSTPQSQPSPPVMRCCGKERIRDCLCLKPDGGCEVPQILLTHYDSPCKCYSCEWMRATEQESIQGRGETIKNPTYRKGSGWARVLRRNFEADNKLELVHPVLINEKEKRWEWVITPMQHGLPELPFLSDNHSAYSNACTVTLGSDGDWKGISFEGDVMSVDFEERPDLNVLYSDYGYHPTSSPYKQTPDGDSLNYALKPEQVNPAGYTPPEQRNKCRLQSAAQDNTTLFIGGIDGNFNNQTLLSLFGSFGEVQNVNVLLGGKKPGGKPCGKPCGFVQFVQRRDAQMAMRQMQGIPVYKCRLRISWGDPDMKSQGTARAERENSNGRRPFQNNYSQPWPQQGPLDGGVWPIYTQPNFVYQQPFYAYPPPGLDVNFGGYYQHQYPIQQQMGYPPPVPQFTAPPPIPPPTTTAPQSAQSAQRDGLFRFDPSVDSWKGNLKGKGPVVAVSPGIVKIPHAQQTESDEKSKSSSESQHTAESSKVEGTSSKQTSPEERASPEREDEAKI
ncbi:hypothetical protein diail_7025 [Diaporthe ilicicola]|nr:hypothetical protein diail_7025 [Diaporthe ilicicola]